MADELLRDLPRDLPTFLARFGTDAQCRAYLLRAAGRRAFAAPAAAMARPTATRCG